MIRLTNQSMESVITPKQKQILARWRKQPTKYQQEHISRAELIRLLEAALESGVGPFGSELVTPTMLTHWLCRTGDGFRLLDTYLATPIAPWPIAIGRVISEVDGIEPAQRCLRAYSYSPVRFYILRNHEHWRQASPAQIIAVLRQNDALYPSARPVRN